MLDIITDGLMEIYRGRDVGSWGSVGYRCGAVFCAVGSVLTIVMGKIVNFDRCVHFPVPHGLDWTDFRCFGFQGVKSEKLHFPILPY